MVDLDHPWFPRRKSLRLPEFEYRQGIFFVTICVEARREILGQIVDGVMQLNAIGKIVDETWQWIGKQYSHVRLDESIIMPNHLHGLLELTEVDAHVKPLGQLIAAFKTVSAKRIHEFLGNNTKIWQRNFYERIIHTERSLQIARQYIRDNPFHWQNDPEKISPIRSEQPTEETTP